MFLPSTVAVTRETLNTFSLRLRLSKNTVMKCIVGRFNIAVTTHRLNVNSSLMFLWDWMHAINTPDHKRVCHVEVREGYDDWDVEGVHCTYTPHHITIQQRTTHHLTLHHNISLHITTHHTTSWHIITHHINIHHITPCHITTHHITSLQSLYNISLQ